QHIVRRASSQGLDGPLLSDRPRYEHEWNVGGHLPGDFECVEATESWHREVAQDDCRPEGLQRRTHRRFRRNTMHHVRHVVRSQLVSCELDLGLLVLYEQHPNRFHSVSRGSLIRKILTPGG